MENVPTTALRRLLNYLEHDERNHYEADPRDDHIFLDIQVVAEWVEQVEQVEAVD
jgi:hypothetical protein